MSLIKRSQDKQLSFAGNGKNDTALDQLLHLLYASKYRPGYLRNSSRALFDFGLRDLELAAAGASHGSALSRAYGHESKKALP